MVGSANFFLFLCGNSEEQRQGGPPSPWVAPGRTMRQSYHCKDAIRMAYHAQTMRRGLIPLTYGHWAGRMLLPRLRQMTSKMASEM